MKRLVYYSLTLQHLAPMPQLLWQLETSIRSLRAHNRTVPVWVFAYGDVPVELRRFLKSVNATLKESGSYERRLAEYSALGWPYICKHPCSHRFLNFSEISRHRPDQVLLLDCDTLFFADVDEIFRRYRTAHCYAQPALGSSRSNYQYEPGYLDESKLRQLARHIDARSFPPICGGVVLFNRGSIDRLRDLQATFVSYLWRLLLWMAKHPLKPTHQDIRTGYREGRGVHALRAQLARFHLHDTRVELPFPSKNRWLLDEVALWLTLGHIRNFKYRDFPEGDVFFFDGLASRVANTFRNGVLCHYFSCNTVQVSRWLAQGEISCSGVV